MTSFWNTPPLISTGDQISADWVAAAIGMSPSAVDAVDPVSLGEAGGLLGELFRVSISYSDGATGPATVIIKLPSDDPQQRGVADALGFYKREVVFYNDHTDGLPFGVAKAYTAIQAEDSTDFVIVMEDLGGLHQIDQVAGASFEQARAAIAQLARFHASYWNHTDLAAIGEVFLPIAHPIYHAALPGIFESGWAVCREKQQEHLTPEVMAFGDSYAELLPSMLAKISEPQTLAHGDFRGDNLLFDSDDNLYILDFQITGVASGIYDIAYFMCQSLDSEVRKGHDTALVQLYVDTLASAGVDYDIDEAMHTYRVATAFCLIYAVTSFQAWEHFDGRQHELMSAMLSRSVQTIIDNDSLAALDSL